MDVILAVDRFDAVPEMHRDVEHTVGHVDGGDEKFVVVRGVAGAGELKTGEGVRIFIDTLLTVENATDIPDEGVEIAAAVEDASAIDHIDVD